MNPLKVGFSPCPNDTFIFGALATGRIPTSPWQFEMVLADVEKLNLLARKATLELTKISVHAFALVAYSYALLRAGAALGRGCGPLVVARRARTMESLRHQSIAVPGRLTTAWLLLQLYGEGFDRVVALPYDSIMPRLQQGEFAAGVVIHEGRFTYQRYGLHRVLDLGRWWEESQNLPVPLGAILIRRDLGAAAARGAEEAIRASLLFARRHPEAVWPYIKSHAQEMDDMVIRQHIDLYVNRYSLDLGEEGILAIRRLLELGRHRGLLPSLPTNLFPEE